MAVIPQAQEDQVQDRGLPGKELPELRLILPGRGGRVVGAVQGVNLVGGDGHAVQPGFLRQAGVAPGVV